MSDLTIASGSAELDFAELHEQFADLTRAARISDEGWAYSLGALTARQVSLLEADVEGIVKAVPPKNKIWHPPSDPHQYRQGGVWSNHGTDLLQHSSGPVDRAAREIAQGVKVVVGGRWFRLGEELAINHMKPWAVGDGHNDKGFRWTGNLSAGPVRVRIHNGTHSEVIENEKSLLIVFASQAWHKFSNPSRTHCRGSVSVGIT